MGYSVSCSIKKIENDKIGTSIGHDFRTSYTKHVRNNNKNSIMDLYGDNDILFASNENLINQNLKYDFYENGQRIYKEDKKVLEINIFDDTEIIQLVEPVAKNENANGRKVFAKIKEQAENLKLEIQNDYKKYSVNNRRLSTKAKFFQEGLIFFGADENERNQRNVFDEDLEGLSDNEINKIRNCNQKEMDQAAKKFVKYFEKLHGVKVLYLVKHNDEKVPHYQFVFSSYNFQEHSSFDRSIITGKTIKKPEFIARNENIQDMIADSFKGVSGIDFVRGVAGSQAKQKTKAQRTAAELADTELKLNKLLTAISDNELIFSGIKAEIRQLNDIDMKIDNKRSDLVLLNEKIDILKDNMSALKKETTNLLLPEKDAEKLLSDQIDNAFENAEKSNGKLSVKNIKRLLLQNAKKNKNIDIQIEKNSLEVEELKTSLLNEKTTSSKLSKQNQEIPQLKADKDIAVAELEDMKLKENTTITVDRNKIKQLVNEAIQDKEDLEVFKSYTKKTVADIQLENEKKNLELEQVHEEHETKSTFMHI